MQIVVETPLEAVGVAFDASFPAAVVGADQLLGVHLQVAVGVVHQPDVRRLEHQDPVVEGLDRPCLNEPIREHRPLVHLSVVVRVLENDDAADGIEVRLRRLEVRDVFRILDHPHAAVRIPVDGDRILDEGFGGHELRVKSRRQIELLHLVFGRQDRRVVGRLLNAGRPRTVRGLLSSQNGDRTASQQESHQTKSSHQPLPDESGKTDQNAAIGRSV